MLADSIQLQRMLPLSLQLILICSSLGEDLGACECKAATFRPVFGFWRLCMSMLLRMLSFIVMLWYGVHEALGRIL